VGWGLVAVVLAVRLCERYVKELIWRTIGMVAVILGVLLGGARGAGAVPAVVSAGGSHSMMVLEDGTLWAWGENGSGQLGDGTTTNKLTPTQVGSATNWTNVAAGA
jgi:hypothetical protein